MTKAGEMTVECDSILCPLCAYRTPVKSWSQYGQGNAQSALASHLCRKKHAMSRKEASALARQQPVVKAGTLRPDPQEPVVVSLETEIPASLVPMPKVNEQ